MDLALNRRASAIADAMAGDATVLGLGVTRLPNGARVIDCGVDARGGFEAGRRLAEACLGGMAAVSFSNVDVGGLWLPAVRVVTDHPVTACLASQYAGWSIDPEGYFAMGSGPARALSRVERELFEKIGYTESSDRGVLVIEGRVLPNEAVASFVADRCRIGPQGLTFLAARTASVAGCVQIAARSVETLLHKMLEVGFDVGKVQGGIGLCPLAPVAKNDLQGIGWTNDCILYGSRVYVTVRASDEEIAAVLDQLPASASPDYGRPFLEIFARYGHDFYKIDRRLFSPAEITTNNLRTGRLSRAGRVNPDALRSSLGMG
jgi:methenyltetrahydromethanopterin cyclohydrolase